MTLLAARQIIRVMGGDELISELNPTREEMIAALDPEQRDTVVEAYSDECSDFRGVSVDQMSELPDLVFDSWQEWIVETTHIRPKEIAVEILENREAEYLLGTEESDPESTTFWQVFTVYQLNDPEDDE